MKLIENIDLIIINIASLFLLLFTITNGTIIANTILALPYILFFPGYLLVLVLFPNKSGVVLFDRILLSIGLSIAIAPLIGLALNFSPWGIRLYPILISLAVFMLILSVVAFYRRGRLAEKDRWTLRGIYKSAQNNMIGINSLEPNNQKIASAVNKDPVSSAKTLNRILIAILIVVVLGSIGLIIYTALAPRQMDKFSEFYLLSIDHKAKGYPRQVTLGDNASVLMGIVNHEQEKMTYRIMVNMDGVLAANLSEVMVQKDEKWEQIVSIIPAAEGKNKKVEFNLYKGESQQPYSTLYFWLDVIK